MTTKGAGEALLDRAVHALRGILKFYDEVPNVAIKQIVTDYEALRASPQPSEPAVPVAAGSDPMSDGQIAYEAAFPKEKRVPFGLIPDWMAHQWHRKAAADLAARTAHPEEPRRGEQHTAAEPVAWQARPIGYKHWTMIDASHVKGYSEEKGWEVRALYDHPPSAPSGPMTVAAFMRRRRSRAC